MDNIYMSNQVWEAYDPTQWVLVSSNRRLLFSAKPPEWVDAQDVSGMRQLEVTMDRDVSVADTFEKAMVSTAEQLFDETFSSLLMV